MGRHLAHRFIISPMHLGPVHVFVLCFVLFLAPIIAFGLTCSACVSVHVVR